MAGRQPRWLGFSFAVLALFAAAMMSCGGSSDAGSVATPTTTPTATGAGFLATWTPGGPPTPSATPVPPPPGAQAGPLDSCPPMPDVMCAGPGDTINLYDELPLERLAAISVLQSGEPRWVLDAARIGALARMFDRDVTLEPLTLPPNLNPVPPHKFTMTLRWRSGEGVALEFGTLDSVPLVVDTNLRVIGNPFTKVQAPLDPAFADLLLGSLSDVTPTPEPPGPTRTPTPGLVPAGTFYFQHPDTPLVWDGPDDRASSYRFSHCGFADPVFGVPSQISLEDGIGFWGTGQVPRGGDWRWTGYYHGDWQIWQSDDPLAIYVVYGSEQRVAWEYRSFLCA